MVEQGFQARQQIAPGFAEQQRAFRRAPGVTQRQAHQEAIQLRFRQGEGAALAGRVLRGDDEERFRQGPGGALDGHLAFFHRLEQGALAFRRGAVDLVGKHQFGEDRPGMEDELPAVLVEHRGTEDIARQQVRGELDALETEPEHPRQGMAEGGLAHPRQVFDQQVPTGQQAGQGQAHLAVLAQENLIDRLQAGFQGVQHPDLAFPGKTAILLAWGQPARHLQFFLTKL